MTRYEVAGVIPATAHIIVEANSPQEAIDIANETFGGVCEYSGNGGYDKLLGVSEENESVTVDGEVEFDSAQEYEF